MELSHPFIHLPSRFVQLTGLWNQSQLTIGEGRVHPLQTASTSPGKHRERHPHTHIQAYGNSNVTSSSCFWIGGELRDNPCIRMENMQTHNRNSPTGTSSLWHIAGMEISYVLYQKKKKKSLSFWKGTSISLKRDPSNPDDTVCERVSK